jgi:hypothetical protein
MQCRKCDVRPMQAATGVLWLTEQRSSAIAIKGLLCAHSYDLEARNEVAMSQCPQPFQRMIDGFGRFDSLDSIASAYLTYASCLL